MLRCYICTYLSLSLCLALGFWFGTFLTVLIWCGLEYCLFKVFSFFLYLQFVDITSNPLQHLRRRSR